LLALLLAAVPAAAEEESEALAIFHRLAPHGQFHFARCWHLEHDYYDLRRRIGETGVVWRRQELERQWAEVRDQRRELCLMGW
jgi:hypothetical protein